MISFLCHPRCDVITSNVDWDHVLGDSRWVSEAATAVERGYACYLAFHGIDPNDAAVERIVKS